MDTKQQQPMEYAVVDKSKKRKKKDDKQQKVNSPLNASYVLILLYNVLLVFITSMYITYVTLKFI